MTPIRWRAAVAGGAVLLVLGCGGPSRPDVHAPTPPNLTAAPTVVATACHDHATASAGLAVLCPARWPPTRSLRPPSLRWLALTPGAYLLNAFNGLDDHAPHVFHLLLGGRAPFRADWTGIDPALRITTRLVRVPIRGGGTFTQQRPARRIGATTVHGHPALLLKEPDYPQGGLQGGQILVLWNQAGHGYLASVHGSAGMTQAALSAIVIALARSTDD